jgi:tetratricopeptide (TPR) repeat protein
MLARRHTTLWIAVAAVLCGACAGATERAQTLVRRHEEGQAIVTLKDRLRGHPGDLPARRLLVRLLGLTGDLPEARVEVEALARWLPPGDPGPYLELGHALELAHQYDEALAAYDEASRVSPTAPDGPREGGIRAARWGELAEAAPRLEEAIRRGARDAELWHVLGLVRLHLGDYDGAVLARVPKFAGAELGRAWALAKLGRKDEARKALDHAEDLGAPPANLARQRAALDALPGP